MDGWMDGDLTFVFSLRPEEDLSCCHVPTISEVTCVFIYFVTCEY